MVDSHELAWAAGFFDGEGWAGLSQPEGRRTGQPRARINQADTQGIPAVLRRFHRAVGLGRVGGPYEKDGRLDLYRWEVSSRVDVETLHHLLLPWLGTVKLAEFATTLGRQPAKSRKASSDEHWRAWCAGLFDGEGWVSMYAHRSHVGYLSAEVGIGQSSAADVPEVLERSQVILGRGRVYGPYTQAGATMDVYRLKASALADVRGAIASLREWLSPVKLADVDLVLEILDAQPALPRGNPAWGNRKTHCVNGHEYATGRLRPYVSRTGSTEAPRDSHQCLVCAREQARERRRRGPEAGGDSAITETAASYLLK